MVIVMRKRKFIVAYFPDHPIEYLINDRSILREDITIVWIGYAESPEKALEKFISENIIFAGLKERLRVYEVT